MQKKLGDVKHFDGIEKEVACKVFIVGHMNNIRQYYTVAESRMVAALAYVSMLGHQGTAIQISQIWVKDETGIQSAPLISETQESISNWLAEKPQRAKLVQAAVNHLNPIVTV